MQALVAMAEPEPAPPVVETIGRYHVSRILGEGSMGRVYLCTDPELSRAVAVKVLRLESAGNARDAFIARFKNEARAAARFSHPHVVAVHDAGVDPVAGPFVVYEYIAGDSLRPVVDAGPLGTADVARVARGVGSALDALHAAGIVHRDIKPDNILLDPDGGVKITDLGIARVPDATLTRDGQFLGTPAYAPPEAITRGAYSPQGDVFSLAAMMYEALTGTRPFPGDNAVMVSYAVVHDDVPPPSTLRPGIPAAVDPVFARGLARMASARYPSAGEFAEALAGALRCPRPGTPAGVSRRTTHGIRAPGAWVIPAEALAPAGIAAVAVLVLVALVARYVGAHSTAVVTGDTPPVTAVGAARSVAPVGMVRPRRGRVARDGGVARVRPSQD